ncbi:cytospin-A isoform X2 [Drosophila ficusphila]|nr:cytospin-A isoform X2 [Drosophila ficusphila]
MDVLLFLLKVDTVMFELETFIRDATKKQLSSSQMNTSTPVNLNPLDELKDLRQTLRDAEVRRELELITHKLMISKEQCFVRHAHKKQKAAELKLFEDRNRLRELEESLSESQLTIIAITGQNEELNESIKQLRKEKDLHEIERLSFQAKQRKCEISHQGKGDVKRFLRLNQLEKETLRDLKECLNHKKESLKENKSAISQIKKEIDLLCFKRNKLRLGVNRISKTSLKTRASPLIKFRENRKDTIHVINKVLRSFNHYDQLKFSDSNFKWNVTMKSLKSNLIMVRKSLNNACIKDLPKPKKKRLSNSTESGLKKGESRSFLKQPVIYPSLSDNLWEKIYKPLCQSPISASESCLPDISSIDLSKYASSIPRTSILFKPTPVSKFFGKTYGDRRVSLLRWCKAKVKPYGLPMYEFSYSWTSGRALCAIIHSYRPDLIDKSYIFNKKPLETLTYGVTAAKSLGVTCSVDFVAECQQRHPNFVNVLKFMIDLQDCLQASE